MSFAITVVTQVLIMFVIVIIGIIAFKLNLVNKDGNVQLTNILLNIVNPMVMLTAYQTPFDKTKAFNLVIALCLAVASHLIGMAFSYIFIRNKNNPNAAVERFSIIYPNCGFMALPLINALFGSDGIFYASAYLIVFNILSWTHGYISMSGKKDIKAISKSFISPTIIAIVVGLVLFFFSIPLPEVLSKSANMIADLNSPIAMLILGISIASTDVFAAFKSKRVYFIVFLMDIVVPLTALFIYSFLPISRDIVLINMIATACPSAILTILFATKFGRDSTYAAKILAVANITCVITIPVVLTIATLVLK
ncbi:MAG: AEC family transporter [Oscillospiraceae bacterium]